METITDELQALETPDMPEIMTNMNSPLVEGAPVLHPNSVAGRSSIRPSGWDDKIAEKFYGLVYDTTGWTYMDNFRPLHMYQRWCATCACHEGPINQCVVNETLGFGPLDWQTFLKAHIVVETVINEETGEQVVVQPKTPSGRAPKGTFKQKVNPDSYEAIKKMYSEGSTIQEVSQEYTIAPQAVRDFLSEEGVLRKKGQSAKPRAEGESTRKGFGRVRSTAFVTPELVAKVVKMLEKGKGGGVVAIAKEANVNPAELSKALKEAGVVIKKGKRKVA